MSSHPSADGAPSPPSATDGFRTLIERNADGVLVVRDDGTILYANPAAGTLLGRPSPELLGQPFGLPVVAGETTELDIPAGGEVRHAEMRVVEATWGGRPALLASLRDVTDRRRSEEAQREGEERFRLLIEGVRDYGLVMLDPAGRIVSWNSGAERLTGYTESEALGRHYGLLFIPDDVETGLPARELRRAAAEGRVEQEGWRLRRDGSRYWASGIVTALRDDDGHLRGFAKVVRDMTERRRMEQELRRRADALAEANRQKTEFLAMLAHELRNPLAPVLNAVHILKLCGVDPSMVEQAREMIEHQVRHMARLVDDLLDVSRITRGKIELRREPVDLTAVVRRAVAAARPFAESRHHQLTTTFGPGPLPMLADPTRIEQVLSNLLNNAAKYTDPGGRIEVEARREGDEALICVRDNGSGIEPEMLTRVFELFRQSERDLDRTQGGLGIGLTLVRSLVELHGGRVEARSDGNGRGSEFVLHLPLDLSATPGPVAPTPRDDGRSADRGPLRVVVVDDNRHAAESLAIILRSWGHDPRIAYDGQEALDVIEAHCPQVVLLDIGLPRLNGYEVARRVLGGCHPPDRPVLLALTGYGQAEDIRRSHEAGFDRHLTKPVDVEILRSLLADPGLAVRVT